MTTGSVSTVKPTEHGEIWWAQLKKRRPIIIVGRDDLRGRRLRTTVASVSSTVRDLPSELLLDEGDGLAGTCAANCEELMTIDKTRLINRIGSLSETKLAELHEALAFALQLD